MNIRKINYFDLTRQYNQLKDDILPLVDKVFREGSFSGGKYVASFEEKFAGYCQVKYTVAVNSGTSALHLALLVLGIKYGDEVIVPTNTFIATAWAVSYVGATPVFVDCKRDTWNIDPSQIEDKITKKTKAIIGVHLYGQPFDVDAVKKIAEKYDLFLIEDCAQAHGAEYKGRKVGGFGEIGCFSFYPSKNLGSYGEGGAITTNNKKIAERIKSLRNHGSVRKYFHKEIGFNMRMEGIQGTILKFKLQYLDKWNQRRKNIANLYYQKINNTKIKLHRQPSWSDSVYYLFVVTTQKRNKLLDYLKSKNIFTGIHYPIPCHLQKAYRFLGYKTNDFPNAEYLSKHCLSLPMFPELTNEEIKYFISIINEY